MISSLPQSVRGERRRQGAAMIMVVIALTIAVILCLTFLSRQSTNIKIAQNVGDHAAARLVAESGLTTAIQYVRNNDDWRKQQASGVWLAEQAYGNGVFRIKFEDEDGNLDDDEADTVTISALGLVAGVSHQVSVRVTAGTSAGGGPFSGEYAIASLGTIILTGNANVDSYDSRLGSYGGSNVGSEAALATNAVNSGAITINGNGHVDGDGYVGPDVDDPDWIIYGEDAITGQTGSLANPIAITAEEPDFSVASSSGPKGGETYGTPGGGEELLDWDQIKLSGNSVVTIDGPVRARVRGKVKISGNANIVITETGSLTLYVEDDLEISGNGNNGGDPQKLKVFMHGPLEASLKGNGQFYGVIIGENTKLDIAGNGQLFGLFAGAAAELAGNAKVHQDLALRDTIITGEPSDSGPAPPQIVWVETE